ncbi:MAG: phage tail tape measure protein, partial [Candidatus Omnitrophota bacterium]
MADKRMQISIDGDARGAINASQQADRAMASLGGTIKGMAIAGGALFLAKQAFDGLTSAIKGTFNFVSDSISIAAEFETSMRNVNSILQMSESEFEKVSDEVTAMSERFPQSAKVLADGLYDIASSGFEGAEGLKVLEASAKAASAGLTTTETSAKGIAAVLNAYAMSADDAAAVSDTMFKTVDKGVITFEELSNTVGEFVAMGKIANVSFNSLSGALAYMTTKGINASEAGTSLNRMILALIDPSEEMAKVIHEAGYESGEAALKHLDLVDVLELVQEASGGSLTELQKLFPEMRALRGASAMLSSGIEDLDTFMANFNDTLGSTDTALAEQSKSFEFQLEILKNGFDNLKKTIGDAFLPVLTNLIEKVTESGGVFDDFGGFVERIADSFGKWIDSNWGSIEGVLDTVFGTVENILSGTQEMMDFFSSDEASNLTFGEKLLAYWDKEILPALKRKVGEAWEGLSTWIDENKHVIEGWGTKLGEFLGGTLRAGLMTFLAMDEEADTSTWVEAGKSFGEGMLTGLRETLADAFTPQALFGFAKETWKHGTVWGFIKDITGYDLENGVELQFVPFVDQTE